MSFPKFVNMTSNKLFFPILHVFAPLNDVHVYIAWSWKTTLITWFFWRGWYPTSNTSASPPPGVKMGLFGDMCEKMVSAFQNRGQNIAPFQITVLVLFSSVWFSLVTVLFIVYPRSLLLCPFHKKTENLMEEVLRFLSNR